MTKSGDEKKQASRPTFLARTADISGPPADGPPRGTFARATIIALPAMLDGSEAEPLRQKLIGALSRGNAIVLDAKLPQRVSTAVVQVILAAIRSVQTAKLDFQITDASPALLTAIADLGLDADLRKWMDPRG